MPDVQCDLRCPGDAGLFCGGFVFSSGQRRSDVSFRRRDAPPDILMTLYGRAVDGTESSSVTSLISTTASTETLVPSSSSAIVAPSEDDVVTSSRPGQSTETVQGPDSTHDWTQNVTELATAVSTVFYSTVDSTNPSRLVVTQVHITLAYTPCPVCANHGVPSIEMTTMTAYCSACGRHGENKVVLSVPKSDCSACAAQGESATDAQRVGESNVQAQSHPSANFHKTEEFSSMRPGGPFVNWMNEVIQFSTMDTVNTHPISALTSDSMNLAASASNELPVSGTQQPSTAAIDNPGVSSAQHVPTFGLQQPSAATAYQPQGTKAQHKVVSVANAQANGSEDQKNGSPDSSILSSSPETATQAGSVWSFGLSTHSTEVPLTTPSMPAVVTAKGAKLPKPEVYLLGAVIALLVSFVF